MKIIKADQILLFYKKIFKKKSALDQDLEIKKIYSERDVMLAKAVHATKIETQN